MTCSQLSSTSTSRRSLSAPTRAGRGRRLGRRGRLRVHRHQQLRQDGPAIPRPAGCRAQGAGDRARGGAVITTILYFVTEDSASPELDIHDATRGDVVAELNKLAANHPV